MTTQPMNDERRTTLIHSLMSSKGWMRGYAEAYVDDFAFRRADPAASIPASPLTHAIYREALLAVVEAAREWSCERSIKDWGEAELAKAVIRLDGDWPGCPDCDFECDEPCVPATVEEQLRRVDHQIAQLVHEGALPAPSDYKPPEGWKPMHRRSKRLPRQRLKGQEARAYYESIEFDSRATDTGSAGVRGDAPALGAGSRNLDAEQQVNLLRAMRHFLESLPKDLGQGSLNGMRVQLEYKVSAALSMDSALEQQERA